MNAVNIDPVVAAVQTNCHIADERHADDMTLCIYLLQMREFSRWERGLAFGAPLPRDAVGAWIAARELLWASLVAQDFVPLPCGPGATALDPFDVDAVNNRLRPRGLVYGAGLVGAGRPVFFLAELLGHERRDGLDVVSAGRAPDRSPARAAVGRDAAGAADAARRSARPRGARPHRRPGLHAAGTSGPRRRCRHPLLVREL